MGKWISLVVVGLISSLLFGCCSTSSTATCLAGSADYFWDIVATPLRSEPAKDNRQCYRLKVALKEKQSDGKARTVVDLPPMSARSDNPANIHIERPGFYLDGHVFIEPEIDGDVIHCTFDARHKGLTLREEKFLLVKRS